jgi:hypothetical protein
MTILIAQNQHSEGRSCSKNDIKRDVLALTEEQQNMLVRRARDRFNKHKGIQLETVVHMIFGGHIRFDNLDVE